MSGNNSKISSCFIKISSFIASPSHSPPPKWGAKMNYALWCLVQYPSFQKLKKHSFEKNLWKVFLFSVKVFYYVTFLYSSYISSLRIYSLLLHLVEVLKKFRNIAKFKMILQLLLMVLQNISKRLPSSFENLLWSWPKCLVDSTSNSSLIAYGVANFYLASVS